jgi:hypothetical protein
LSSQAGTGEPGTSQRDRSIVRAGRVWWIRRHQSAQMWREPTVATRDG